MYLLSRKALVKRNAVILGASLASIGTVFASVQPSLHEDIEKKENEVEGRFGTLKKTPSFKFVKELVENTGLVRFGRAAVSVLSVIIDYKYLFWKYEANSEIFKTEKSKCHLRSAIRLRDLCCMNGGIFIKVGQHLGALDYLLPAEYVNTMKVLHTDAPQSSFEDVVQVVEQEFGRSYCELFNSFSEKPVGSASLAQFLVAVVKKLFPDFQFTWLVEEIKRNLPLELDFCNEGKNCEMLGRMVSRFPYLKVPKIHWDLTTRRLLAMDFCEGGRIDDLEFIEKSGLSKIEISSKIGQLYSEMIFVNGYIHCDPHPGNILVSKNKHNEAEIIMLDHGLYQTLTDEFRVTYCKLWQALVRADVDAIKHHSDALGVGDMYGLFACIISARSWDAITSGIDKTSFSKQEMKEIQNFAVKYIPEITEILNRVPRQMILLLKTNDLLRGIDSKLSATRSFVTLSKCCLRAVKEYDLSNCNGLFCWFSVQLRAKVDEMRITLYQISMSSCANQLSGILTLFIFPIRKIARFISTIFIL
ncbi:aarF domain-containing protein kinase 1-like isoform X2 [Rhopilema esculentum]|uniref:aarF domain-containing protein kinase 1-like isoform X2 n=1 Tax=Rhopilema esculentum TaxID=499914 RepID=UPI0031DE1B24